MPLPGQQPNEQEQYTTRKSTGKQQQVGVSAEVDDMIK